MNSPYLSLHLLEQETTPYLDKALIPLVRQEVNKAIADAKPYQKGLVFQSACRLTLKAEQSLIRLDSHGLFEEQMLSWVSKQVGDESQQPLTLNQWKKIKSLDSWLDIFFKGARIAPKNVRSNC